MKKILSLILVCIMFFGIVGFSFNVSAEQNNENLYIYTADIPKKALEYVEQNYFEIFSIIKNTPENFGLSTQEANDLVLGEGFRTYKDIDGEIVENNLFFFPVIHETQIVGLLDVKKIDSFYKIGYKKGFAKELNNLYNNSPKNPYVLVYINDALVAFDKENKIIVEKPKYIIKKYNSKKNLKEECKLNNLDILKEIKKKNIKVKNLTNPSNMLGVNDAQIYSIQSNSESKNLSVPIVPNQTIDGNGICWAASMASVVNYKKGTSYTAKDIYDKYGNFTDAWYKHVENGYKDEGLSHAKFVNNDIGINKLKSEINNDRPVDTYMKILDNSAAHEVVVRGYYDFNTSSPTESKYASIMDPNQSDYRLESLIVVEKVLIDDLCYFAFEINGKLFFSDAHFRNLY